MSQKQDSRFCAHCQKQTMAIGNKPNHLLHLILSVMTAGVWAFVWLLVAVGSMGGYRCTQCGAKV